MKKGTIHLRATEPAEDGTECEIHVGVEIYAAAFDGLEAESKTLVDWNNWCLAWASSLKVGEVFHFRVFKTGFSLFSRFSAAKVCLLQSRGTIGVF